MAAVSSRGALLLLRDQDSAWQVSRVDTTGDWPGLLHAQSLWEWHKNPCPHSKVSGQQATGQVAPEVHQCLLALVLVINVWITSPFLSSFPPTSLWSNPWQFHPSSSLLFPLSSHCSPSPVSSLHGTFLALPVNVVSPHSPWSPKGQCGFYTLGLGTTVHVRVAQLALNISILFLRCSPDHPCNWRYFFNHLHVYSFDNNPFY